MKQKITQLYQFILLLLFPIQSYAQKEPTIIGGTVIDAFTHDLIEKEVNVSLLALDSTVLETTKCRIITDEGSGKKRTYWQMEIPEQKNQNFILRYTGKEYQTVYRPAKMEWWKSGGVKKFYWNLQLRPLPLSAREHVLGEVTVTGTKIKFYINGDTLAYNANAFQLQEGSMLDALISQLPGVELGSDGRITVNGEFVESLLLNGRDFFKGDNTVLLDNLPAYMVRQVQVYKKESDLSKAVGSKMDEGTLVMDVKLKKQYAVGWIANAEMGYGTKERYLGRLFAMRYTPQSHVSFFANMNNVNDRRKPDGNGSWSDFDPTGGLTKTKRAGANYSVIDKRERFDVSGSADITYSDNENVWGGSSTTFLVGGDTYDSKHNISKSSNLTVSTSHTIKLGLANSMRLNFYPNFSYYKNDYTSSYMNGTFSVKPTDNYVTVIDSLFSPGWMTAVCNMIKRNGEWAEGKGHGSSGGLKFWTYIKLNGNSQDGFNIEGDISYSDRHKEDRNHFTYNWYENNQLVNDYRNRYNNTPSNDFGLSINTKYIWHWNNDITLNPSYSFNYGYASGDKMHYYINTADESGDLNWLPSQFDELMKSLDESNSFTTRSHQYKHSMVLDWQFSHGASKSDGNGSYIEWYIRIKPELTIRQNKFDFFCSMQKQKIDKTYLLPQMHVTVEHHTKEFKHYISANLSMENSTPDMLNLVDKTFSSDPLNITLGNPDLKKRTDFKVSLYYQSREWLKNKGQMLYGNVGADFTRNAISMSYIYDKITGVKTNRPMNVNGYWHPWANVGFTTPIDKKRKLTLKISSRVSLYHKIDYSSSSEEMSPVRMTVDESYYTGDAKVTYRYKRLNFGISGNISYNHTTANRSDFNDVDTWAYRYGANAVMELPWKMQLSTDLTMFSRRGYASQEMNRDDLVWNARLSKSMCNNTLTIMLDAWDILGNLSNVVSGVNSQSRWEYYYNVIPRYVMLRLAYKLGKQPKKK